MSEAAKKLFISQPSLSLAIKELEKEVHITIFDRTTKGVHLTAEGEEFAGYARQVLNQVELLTDRYGSKENIKKKFCVSCQHYSFAVKAFVEMVKGFDLTRYQFAIKETRTAEVIEDVRDGISELGILYLNDFNEKVLTKIMKDDDLQFTKLFTVRGYVYLYKDHPLAGKEKIELEQLQPYPCLTFEQGESNSFYFSEEILPTYDFKKVIKTGDRATNLNLMVGLNAFTLCSGLICEELNGSDYVAVPLADEDVFMDIGYITRSHSRLSEIGTSYIEEIKKYVGNVLQE